MLVLTLLPCMQRKGTVNEKENEDRTMKGTDWAAAAAAASASKKVLNDCAYGACMYVRMLLRT